VKREQVELWLAQRQPDRPAELSRHMTHALEVCDEAGLDQARTMSDALGLLGLEALKRVVERRSGSQKLAMDLLAADAFVTYAFEAAAQDGGEVEPLVSRLLERTT